MELRTGAPWRDLPERYGPWETAHGWLRIHGVPGAVIVAVCLAVYFTLPETGSKTLRATVALQDTEVVEGELKEAAVRAQTRHSPS